MRGYKDVSSYRGLIGNKGIQSPYNPYTIYSLMPYQAPIGLLPGQLQLPSASALIPLHDEGVF